MKLTTAIFFKVMMICLFLNSQLHGQSYSYWTQNFNEESSLLSGAVVAGGSGPSAIYYNPAAIVAGGKSMFSINASLFTLDINKLQNALGDGIDLKSSNLVIQPRFISVLLQPSWNENLSMEMAIFNNESYELGLHSKVDNQRDILTYLPGEERYYASYQYRNKYRDDWFGIGAAWRATPEVLLGLSTYGSVRTLRYEQEIDIEAIPLADTIFDGDLAIPFYSANYLQSEFVRFNDYRLLWKLGMLYTKPRFSFGITLKTPSIQVYSDGKKVSRKEKQSNIMAEGGQDFMADYVIVDAQEKKAVKTNFRDPLSIAFGIMLNNPDKSYTAFLTAEWNAWIDPYRMVSAPVNPNITTPDRFESMTNPEWLSYAHAAKPVTNVAIGYRHKIAENLLLMGGIKTNLNYRKGVDYKSFSNFNKMSSLEMNAFHLSGGLRLNIKDHELIAGLNYASGNQKGRSQIINLAEPVEYNTLEGKALQGTRQNTMQSRFHSLSLYFGANLSFIR